MSAQATPERPGEWVDGIGWVASWDDLGRGDEYGAAGTARVHPGKVTGEVHGGVLLVIVTRWADGTVPSPPPSPQPDHAELEGLVERLRAFNDAIERMRKNGQIEVWDNPLSEAADALAGGHGPQPDEGLVPLDETEGKVALQGALAETDERSGYAADAEVLRWVLEEAGVTLCRRSIPSGGA